MISLPDTVFIAFGVVTASIIAGIFSYINLISTKESKVSEFRQNWINDLRHEISEYVSATRSLIERLEHDNYGQMVSPYVYMSKKNKHGELYNKLLNSKLRIELRINNKEKNNEIREINDKFLTLVKEINTDFESMKFDTANDKMNELVDTSRSLLKYEWNRARDGEKAYRHTKYAAIATIAASILFLIVVAVLKINPASESDGQATSVEIHAHAEEQQANSPPESQSNMPAPQAEVQSKPVAQ